MAFLDWLAQDNFVFLGTASTPSAGPARRRPVQVVPGSGSASCRRSSDSAFAEPARLAELPPGLRERIAEGPAGVVSKTNREATVHRRVKMDYLGVKRVARTGAIIGELRMVGLFTSKAYMEPARHIPLVRRKLEHIMEAEDLFPGSHDHKAVVSIFESFPKDELFAASAEDLRATMMALLGLEKQRQIRLFVRPDLQGRSVFATVALPRDNVSTELRMRLQSILEGGSTASPSTTT